MNGHAVPSALPRGRVLVLLVYGGLFAQIVQYGIVTALHLPKALNALQFALLAAELVGWLGLRRVTRGIAERRRGDLDERERAEVDRAGWIAFRVLGACAAAVTGGYLLFGAGGLALIPAPSREVLSFMAFAVWVLVWTLSSAVLAWRNPSPPELWD